MRLEGVIFVKYYSTMTISYDLMTFGPEVTFEGQTEFNIVI